MEAGLALKCSKAAVRASSRSMVVRKKRLWVRGPLGCLPDTLDGVELGSRVAGGKLDAVTVGGEPLLADRIEIVAGPVVDDEEDLAAEAADEVPEELQEGRPTEPLRELVNEARLLLKGDGAKDMSRLAHAKCRHARLLADPRPGVVQRAVEPEARLVAEHHDTATGVRFFLSLGIYRGAKRLEPRHRPGEALAWALDGEPEPVEHPRDVMVMVPNAGVLLDEVAIMRPVQTPLV